MAETVSVGHQPMPMQSSAGSAPAKMINSHVVEAITGLSRSTLWRAERRGDFPARRRLSVGRVAWDEGEVLAWVASRPRGIGQAPAGGRQGGSI